MKITKKQLIGSQRFVTNDWMWVVDKLETVTHDFRSQPQHVEYSRRDTDVPANLRMGRGMKFNVVSYRRKHDGIPAYFECVAKKKRRYRKFWVEEDELLRASSPVANDVSENVSIKEFIEHLLH